MPLTHNTAPRRITSLVLALVSVGAATLGVLSPSPAHAAAGTPKVGQCHQYSIAVYNASTDPTAPVTCSKRHDAITIAVGHLPKSITYAEIASMTGKAARIIDRVCDRAVARRLHASVRQQQLTAYTAAYFVAPQARFDAGAHRFRCDLVLVGAHRLIRLPAHPHATGALSAAATRCLSRTDLNGGAWYSCKDPHLYRAIGTFVVRGKGYPSAASFQRQAQRHCGPLLGRHAGVSFPPSRLWWSHGGRVSICYLKTHH